MVRYTLGMGKPCTNCDKPVGPHGARGYCPTCYARWKRNGAPVLQPPKVAGGCSNCGEPTGLHGAQGYCPPCYQRWRRHGDPNITKRVYRLGPTCSECDDQPIAKGYCKKHYQRWKKHGDPGIVLTTAERDCSHCGDPVGRHGAYGYCGRCYARWRRHGDPGVTLTRGGYHDPSRSDRSQSGCSCGDVARKSSGGRYRKYCLNDEYFDAIDTPGKAYWLGFITADGCVMEDAAGRPASLVVELARYDDGHLRTMCLDLGSDRPVLYNRQFAGVSFGSRHMANALCRLGVTPRKSLIVEPWDGSAELMPHYWRGLVDGDGTIHTSKSRWCVGICGSYACVSAFGSWARGVTGGRAQPRPARKDTACWQWTSQGSEKSQLLAAALYGDAPVALERKRLLARELCAIDFAARKTQRYAAMADGWATGRISRAGKT